MNKRITAMAAAALFATAGISFGQQYPPTITATPSASTYPPTAAQAAPPPAPPVAPLGAKIQVFPFQPVGNPAGNEWIGKGLQASLQSDVSRSGGTLVLSTVPDGTDPVAAAKASGATLAVTGTYQVENGQVRADGHLIDTATGQPAGSFSGRAPVGNVFQLEDAMGEQLRHLLPADRPSANVGQLMPAANVPGAVRPDGTPVNPPPTYPATVIVTPTPTLVQQATPTDAGPATYVSNYYPADGSAYGDGYAGYPYGYGYGGYPYGYYGFGVYDPFVFGFYGRYGGYGYGRGYGYYGRGSSGYGYRGGVGRGYGVGPGGGRAYGSFGGGGGVHAFAAGGGGFHGGGGGRR